VKKNGGGFERGEDEKAQIESGYGKTDMQSETLITERANGGAEIGRRMALESNN